MQKSTEKEHASFKLIKEYLVNLVEEEDKMIKSHVIREDLILLAM